MIRTDFLGLLLVVLLSACAARGAEPRLLMSEADVIGALEAARAEIEVLAGGPVVLILDVSIDENLQASILKSQKAVSQRTKPRSEGFSLLAGQFLLQSLSLDGAMGRLSGTLGPVPILRPPTLQMACGTYFVVGMVKESADWRAEVLSLGFC